MPRMSESNETGNEPGLQAPVGGYNIDKPCVANRTIH